MHEAFLRRLLEPLGVYDLSDGKLNAAELAVLGAELDRVEERLEYAERESLTATAEAEGLRRREALFRRRGGAVTEEERRAAIAALLQIDGDSLTPAAMDVTLRGCGIRARAVELGSGVLRVLFPGVAGVPEAFERIREIVLEILPCHLEVEFWFRYLTWQGCEAAGWTWAALEAAEHTWESFQKAVNTEYEGGME